MSQNKLKYFPLFDNITKAVCLINIMLLFFNQESINNRYGFHYVMSVLAHWPVLLMAVSEVWRDKPAVARDIGDGLY